MTQMPIELMMLAYAVVWLFVIILVTTLFSLKQRSLPQLAGPRDDLSAPTGMYARGLRNVENHKEGLILFAPFALIVGLGGLSDQWTVLGAQLFFWSRLAHGVLYFLGVPWLRTLAWLVGIVGTAMLACAVIF